MLFQMQRWHEKEHTVMCYASFKTRYTLLQKLLSLTMLDVWFFLLLFLQDLNLRLFGFALQVLGFFLK